MYCLFRQSCLNAVEGSILYSMMICTFVDTVLWNEEASKRFEETEGESSSVLLCNVYE